MIFGHSNISSTTFLEPVSLDAKIRLKLGIVHIMHRRDNCFYYSFSCNIHLMWDVL